MGLKAASFGNNFVARIFLSLPTVALDICDFPSSQLSTSRRLLDHPPRTTEDGKPETTSVKVTRIPLTGTGDKVRPVTDDDRGLHLVYEPAQEAAESVSQVPTVECVIF